MILRSMTAGDISGTGTIDFSGNPIVGGVLISADGTNAATVVLRKTDASGEIIFDCNTINSMFVGAPIAAAETVHYSITGTGGTAQIYQFVP